MANPFKKILGAFVVLDETEQPVQTPNVAVQPVQTPIAEMHQTIIHDSVKSSTGIVDQKFVDHFANLLEKENLPGPDYFEFAQALSNLKNSGLSEEQMFKSTFTIFTSLGGSSQPSALIVAANKYIDVLNKDKMSFKQDFQVTIDSTTKQLQKIIETKEKEVEAARVQIATLQKTIADNLVEITNSKKKIEEQTIMITSNDKNYDVTHAKFIEQIQSDIAKIQLYLK